MKVFIYENNFKLGIGIFASIDGYKLVEHKGHENVEVIPDENGRVYGRIYDIEDDDLEMLDIYYGVSLLHERHTVPAKLEGGAEIQVEMYEFIHAKLV